MISSQYGPNKLVQLSTRYKDERGEQTTFIMSFSLGFCQNYRQESKNKVSTSYESVLSSKILPKHDLVRSIRDRSSLIRTAQETNQKAPFQRGLVQLYNKLV